MGLISFAVIGLVGLAVLTAISWVIAYISDPRFREKERREAQEVKERMRKMREQEQKK